MVFWICQVVNNKLQSGQIIWRHFKIFEIVLWIAQSKLLINYLWLSLIQFLLWYSVFDHAPLNSAMNFTYVYDSLNIMIGRISWKVLFSLKFQVYFM